MTDKQTQNGDPRETRSLATGEIPTLGRMTDRAARQMRRSYSGRSG